MINLDSTQRYRNFAEITITAFPPFFTARVHVITCRGLIYIVGIVLEKSFSLDNLFLYIFTNALLVQVPLFAFIFTAQAHPTRETQELWKVKQINQDISIGVLTAALAFKSEETTTENVQSILYCKCGDSVSPCNVR